MKAVFSGIDTHAAHSLKFMLEDAGYDEFVMLTDKTQADFNGMGYRGGVPRFLLDNMGYCETRIPITGTEKDLEDCDLFVDLKEPDIDWFVAKFPRLKDRSLHFLTNGGNDYRQKAGIKYPCVTVNMWVEGKVFKEWPPYINVLDIKPREKMVSFGGPIGLMHAARSWGYGASIDKLIAGVNARFYGAFGSPSGIIPQKEVPKYLEEAICFLHPKSTDCPGYALYEALASGVPVVLSRFLVERMHYQDMYENGVTCLTWEGFKYERIDEETGDIINEAPVTEESLDGVVQEVRIILEKLKDPDYNYKIGRGGYERWKKLTEWTPEKSDRFKNFLKIYDFL